MRVLILHLRQNSGSQQPSATQSGSSQSVSGNNSNSGSSTPTSTSVQQTVIVTTVTTMAPSTSWHTGVVVSNGQTVTTSFPQVSSVSTTQVITRTSIIGGANGGKKSSTSQPPASTAPSSINGGGTGAPNGAPSPGESGSHGKYGPNETYIASALAVLPPLPGKAMLITMAGMAVGAGMVFV
ncbi:hypothetical protein C8Q72DRAFT_818465 [Fomitopsis betulina]|nr:hypothetical protein C8Q72DRAFT_818465 [Fomitopsis betulina]